ncbi:hypothetical protein [Brevundimonas sp. UBA7534]|jgi:hypothetical protein|uniref:hypothetical protein n=1 Tax=Brevundimonas sp. UBA7534 TaxID=1946138 RepID=UPI0025C2180F|nr:hypothetical protein [Brevundimonas sp. UBA7534]
MRSPPEHGWLLGALSAEMDRTREGLGRVEALVARLAPHAPDADRRQTAVEAQELDVLSQTLAAVSTVLTRLGDGASTQQALAGLPLSDLVRRLDPTPDEPSEPASSGDVQLF